MRALWAAGFDAASPDGVSVPEPIGLVAEFGMWLQRKAPGTPVTPALTGPGGAALARRVADAIHKLHRAGVPATRTHTIADEQAVLGNRLGELARERPAWAGRLARLFDGCRRLAADTPPGGRCGVHRDFYPDQVLADGPRLVLLDFDLYCETDPALDAGNFLGHLTEYAVRTAGRPDALAAVEAAFADRFVELTGEACRPAVRTYALLTLARHVGLSTRFPDRRAYTEHLLDLCEERVGREAPAYC
jgi:aminoglycoside phosphotransferase (APT) family kinase protein